MGAVQHCIPLFFVSFGRYEQSYLFLFHYPLKNICMFAYLEGSLVYKSPSLVYMDVHGVGYELNITLQTYSAIQTMERAKLFTHLQVREDAWVLYGFADEEERATFRQLLSISGVGAVTARIILSSLNTGELERAVNGEDNRTLERVKGIGAKTAQRIILELKGKLQKQKNTSTQSPVIHNTTQEDALIALVNLGISRGIAESAIKKLDNASSLTVEELIKQALRAL
jgi:holliday junction DNA helicase RuvA